MYPVKRFAKAVLMCQRAEMIRILIVRVSSPEIASLLIRKSHYELISVRDVYGSLFIVS